jgi:N-acetylmuramoyl-L-alanine amidase
MEKLARVSPFLTALLRPAAMACCLLSCLLLQGGAPRPFPSLRTIVIDAGHGGKDPGCLGRKCKEKDVALSIALQFGKLVALHMPEVKVVYTRKTDVFVTLQDRAKMANRAGADLFISIHCNANLARGIVGSETYVMGVHASKGNLEVAMRENAVIMQEADYQRRYEGFDPKSTVSHILLSNAQSAHQANSLLLASKVESHFARHTRRVSRGVKQSGFWVLAKTGMPSVLVETGFLTTPEEEAYLCSGKGQALVAASLYRALRDYRNALEGQ